VAWRACDCDCDCLEVISDAAETACKLLAPPDKATTGR
jgi:hypothetical protein